MHVGPISQEVLPQLVLGLYVEWRGLLEMLISNSGETRAFVYVFMREFIAWA